MRFSVQKYLGSTLDKASKDRLLARVLFDSEMPEEQEKTAIVTGLSSLDEVPLRGEDWLSNSLISAMQSRGMSCHFDDEMLWGQSVVSGDDNLDSATASVYTNLFKLIKEAGFPFLARVWHYLPDINAEENGQSRYELLCIGRNSAFKKNTQQNTVERYCAATVIGTQSKRHVIYFIATRTENVPIENRLQNHPWEYPDVASDAKPLFVRATWSPSLAAFFISGTASIVGYKSLYVGDTVAQVGQIFENLQTLIQNHREMTNVVLPRRFNYLKVYLKSAAEAAQVKTSIEQCLQEHKMSADMVLLLEGEVCRPELSVEIEALIGA